MFTFQIIDTSAEIDVISVHGVERLSEPFESEL